MLVVHLHDDISAPAPYTLWIPFVDVNRGYSEVFLWVLASHAGIVYAGKLCIYNACIHSELNFIDGASINITGICGWRCFWFLIFICYLYARQESNRNITHNHIWLSCVNVHLWFRCLPSCDTQSGKSTNLILIVRILPAVWKQQFDSLHHCYLETCSWGYFGSITAQQILTVTVSLRGKDAKWSWKVWKALFGSI